MEGEIDQGNAQYGIVGGECLTVLDNVFVPWERVFMDGETDFAGLLVERFACYHRQNYGGCKGGVSDIVIGLTATLPSEGDLRHPEIGPYIEKYFKGVAGVSTENRLRMARLVENMTGGTALVESMHGAGSPQAQKVMYSKLANLEHKKRCAKKLAGCKPEAE